MKICIALHQCMDLGGIINHTEQLMRGLFDLGHTVHLREMVWKEQAPTQKKSGCYELSEQGIKFSQGSGWNFPDWMRLPYKGNKLASAIRELVSYDIVIWTIPVPPKNKDNIGNNDWINLLDLPNTKQVVFSHDGNASRNYPHILGISKMVDGLACVHHCAYNTCSFVDIPRALILNPQERPVREVSAWEDRNKGFVSAQTFKAWKRTHELIGAIRYMPKREENETRSVFGKGIEYQYLTSEDKCKDAYFHEDGVRFWDAAIDNEMTHGDYVPYKELSFFMDTTLTLVDPSWSKRYSEAGGHYNRVVIEAMINGAVPIARQMGMGGELFTADVNYVDIPKDCSLKEYAEVVHEAGYMNSKKWKGFRDENLKILPNFERRIIANQVIDLAMGNLDTVIGEPTGVHVEKSHDILWEHYGILGEEQ